MSRFIDENFEGVGYEESWTETVGTGNVLDQDFLLPEDVDGAMPPASGTECLNLIIGTNQNSTITDNATTGNKTTWCTRFWFKVDSFSIASYSSGDYAIFLRVRNSANNATFNFVIQYSGSTPQFVMSYYSGSVLYSSGYSYTPNTWYRIEMKYSTSGAGSWAFDVFNIAGTNVFSTGGASLTSPRTPNNFRVGYLTGTAKNLTCNVKYDQMVCDDTTNPIGADTDHSFTISNIYPTSDYLVTWSHSTGTTNYERVDDTDDSESPDEYVYYGGSGSVYKDLYGLPAQVGSLGKILGVRLKVRAKRWTGTYDKAYLTLLIKIGGVEYDPEPTVVGLWTDDYKNLTYEWDFDQKNPNSGLPWTWADIENLKIGFSIQGDEQGVYVTRCYLEVIHGSYKHRRAVCCPVFGGVTNNQIKVFTKAARPPFETDYETAYIRVRYDTNSSNLSSFGGTPTSSVQLKINNDWTNIFTISSLSANTKYFFDVDVSYDGSTWQSMHDDFAMSYYPECYTAPTPNSDFVYNYAVYSDNHSIDSGDTIPYMMAASPRFILGLGDFVDYDGLPHYPFDIVRARKLMKQMYSVADEFVQTVLHKVPLMRMWDDHDYVENNGNKHAVAADRTDTMKVWQEYTPCHDYPSEGKITGTTTSTVANKLVDSGKSFSLDNVHAQANGGSWVRNTTDNTWALVTSVDLGTQLALTSDIFTSGETYEIYNGIFHKFTYGNVEFFLPDLRWMRDTDGINHGDMMDGTVDGGGSGTGHIQRSWLISSVNSSSAKFKCICSSVVFNATATHTGETWGDYDAYDDQRNYLVSNITASDVFVHSSDMHCTGLDDGTNSDYPEMLCGTWGGLTPTGTWSEGSEGGTDYKYYNTVDVSNNSIVGHLYRHTGDELSFSPMTFGIYVIQQVLSVVESCSATFSGITTFCRSLVSQAVGSLTFGKALTLYRTLSSVAGSTSTFVKNISKTLGATVTSIADLVATFISGAAQLFYQPLSAVASSTATVATLSTHYLSVVVTEVCTVTLTMLNTFYRSLSSVGSGSVMLTKGLFKSLVSAVIGIADLIATYIAWTPMTAGKIKESLNILRARILRIR
jgi:phosphodiesterase/alkaline phosphatase D-like protein